ncbi:MAG: alpha/beta hydrolase [Acidimicrobiia bacterium]|nr:alpha/beta hydrolase [Acidimicrobiia bacterium]
MRVDVERGLELHVDARGDGPGLVLVHGFGGASDDFADHHDDLAERFRTVTFDHRGHGRSDGPADAEYSIDRFGADTLAVADHLGLDRFHLVGYSMGGMAARRVALRAPERLLSLVLMDTCGGPTPMMDAELMTAGATLVDAEGMGALKALMDEADPLGSSPAHQRLLAERDGYADFLRWRWEALAPAMYSAMLREFPVQTDDHDALRSLRLSTLVMVGEHDTEFLEPSRRLADVIDGARLVTVPEAGHAPQFEAPDVWYAALTDFLLDVAFNTV